MRRRLTLTSAFVAMMMCAVPARAATITFDGLTDVGNGQFTVNMNIVDVVDLFTFGLDVIYDPALVSFDASEGDFLSGAAPDALVLVDDGAGGLIETEIGSDVFSVPADAGLPGAVAGFIFGYAAGATGSGVLATLQFQLLTAGGATIAFANPLFFDSAAPFGNPIDVDLAPASLTLGQIDPAPAPEPSTLLLMGAGLAGLARRRFSRAK